MKPSDPVASATASSDCTRESAPYAICTRSTGLGFQPLSGPPAVSSVGVKVAASATAGRTSDRSRRTTDASASAAGICEPHACQIAGDSTHGSTALYGHSRTPPSAIAAMPLASWRSAVADLPSGPASTRAASPSAASAEASAPFAMSQAGTRLPSDTVHRPYFEST